VTLSRDRAALGGVVEATYRFLVAYGAALDADYRVFVHFLDNDNGLMWTDDHDPPVPTSRWKATIEYTRTIFVPIVPYVGEAVVQVGLYSPVTHARAPLVGDDMGGRAYRAARLHIAPQTDGVVTVQGEGWYQSEGPPSAEWRWTKKNASLLFQNPGTSCVVYLDVDNPVQAGEPRQVTVSVGGSVVGQFTAAAGRQTLQKIPVSAGQVGSDDPVRLELSVDRTVVPRQLSSASADDRELGVRVFHLVIAPADLPRSLPAK